MLRTPAVYTRFTCCSRPGVVLVRLRFHPLWSTGVHIKIVLRISVPGVVYVQYIFHVQNSECCTTTACFITRTLASYQYAVHVMYPTQNYNDVLE